MNGFAGATFTPPVRFPSQTNAFLEFAIRAEGAPVTSLKVQFGGVDSAGASTDSAQVALPSINNNWQVLRIPLRPAMVPDQISQIRLLNTTSASLPAIHMDAVEVTSEICYTL